MTVEVHFVQGGDEPILAGVGTGTLNCPCGHTLITGYNPERVLGVGLQCARCGAVTTTPLLPDGAIPSSAAIVAEPSSEPRMVSMTVPLGVAVIGRVEMERLGALYRPVTPENNTYRMSPELVEEAAEAYERHVVSALPTMTFRTDDPFRGLRDHALGWSVAHLRAAMQDPSWSGIQNDVTAVATLHVAAFLHFVATWSHHPLFPAMAATAADRGCSLHGLTPFAAAHSVTLMGQRIVFPTPLGYPGRIESFGVMISPADAIPVRTAIFDKFEFPSGVPWDPASLRAAVSATIDAVQGQINLRHPGLLLLSPGLALGGFDGALNQAVEAAMSSAGRKNRGLMAVAAVMLRQQPMPDPASVRFGYGFFPVTNRRYQGEPLRMGS